MILQLPESTVHLSRAGPQRPHAAQQEFARAEADYLRLRGAYLELSQMGHGHEVALAMVGADMHRAQAKFENLTASPPGFALYHDMTEATSRADGCTAEDNL